MKIDRVVTFHGTERQPLVEALIERRIDKLEQLCDHLGRCRVAVEVARQREHPGYRVRIRLTVPPSHELFAETNPGDTELQDLKSCVHEAFDRAEREVTKLTERQRGEVKRHPEQQFMGVVSSVEPEQRYGFLSSDQGTEIYFHANSVVNADFSDVRPGMGVHYEVEAGERGPQATSVRIVNHRGHSAAGDRANRRAV